MAVYRNIATAIFTAGAVYSNTFSPRQIAKVTACWRTDMVCAVDSWTDQKSARTFVQATGGNQPTLVASAFGSKPALRFNGTSSFMTSTATLANLISNTAGRYYLVVKPIAVTWDTATKYDNDGYIGDLGGYFVLCASTSTGFDATNYDGSADLASAALVAGTKYVVTIRHESGNISLRKNVDSFTDTASGNTADLTFTQRMGRAFTATHYGNFDIGALVSLNAAPTATEDARLLWWCNKEFGGIY